MERKHGDAKCFTVPLMWASFWKTGVFLSVYSPKKERRMSADPIVVYGERKKCMNETFVQLFRLDLLWYPIECDTHVDESENWF